MPNAAVDRIGYAPIGSGRINTDGVPYLSPGTMFKEVDPFWGGGEVIYCRATGVIPQFGLVALGGSWDSVNNRWSIDATAIANVANQGVDVGIAMTNTTASGQMLYVKIAGISPVNATSSLAVGAAVGIGGVGQAGAVAAGKQILGISVIGLASTTVTKNGCYGLAGQNLITVPNSDGLFKGAYISGTGIPAGSTIVDISPDGQSVTISAALTAPPTSIVVTYNNGTTYYPICFLNRPGAQGQIT